jgi:hypothetical protein
MSGSANVPARYWTTMDTAMAAASATPRGTLAKNETMSSSRPMSGIRKVPLITWRKCPSAPSHVGGSFSHPSMTDLSSVAPSSIQVKRPAMAQTITMA